MNHTHNKKLTPNAQALRRDMTPEHREKDAARDAVLAALGVTALRF